LSRPEHAQIEPDKRQQFRCIVARQTPQTVSVESSLIGWRQAASAELLPPQANFHSKAHLVATQKSAKTSAEWRCLVAGGQMGLKKGRKKDLKVAQVQESLSWTVSGDSTKLPPALGWPKWPKSGKFGHAATPPRFCVPRLGAAP